MGADEHTASPSRADGAVAGVAAVAANVPDLGVEETLVGKVLAEEVLDAPEAAGGDCAFLRVRRDALGCAFGVKTHLGGGGEGTEEAGHEVGHTAGHDQ